MTRRNKKDVPADPGEFEYLVRIRNGYGALSDSERRVADVFLGEDKPDPLNITVKSVADLAGTSVATVVRFCKSLGFASFFEFKFSLQRETVAPIGGGIRIGGRDAMGIVKRKVAEFAKRKIDASIGNTDSGELERAVEALERCRRVIFCSTGTVSGGAISVANNFMMIGIPCYTVADPLTLLRTIAFCDESDVVIGITNCGAVKSVVDALMLARERGAVTICVTGEKDSLVTRYSDIVLNCALEDRTTGLDAVTVSVCQLLTLQMLQVGVLTRRNIDIAQNIDEVYSLSEMIRYAPGVKEVEHRRVRF